MSEEEKGELWRELNDAIANAIPKLIWDPTESPNPLIGKVSSILKNGAGTFVTVKTDTCPYEDSKFMVRAFEEMESFVELLDPGCKVVISYDGIINYTDVNDEIKYLLFTTVVSDAYGDLHYRELKVPTDVVFEERFTNQVSKGLIESLRKT